MYSSLDVIKQQFKTELSSRYAERETLGLYYRIVEYVTGLKKVDVILTPMAKITSEQSSEIAEIVNRLKLGEPIQYIDNTAYFLEHSYFVDESVLIPRPETEELVKWVLDQHSDEAVKVLDIGTGSGIIPISLAIKRPNWTVLACDISNEALVTARRNAREILSQTDVAFYHEDILNPKSHFNSSLDIIVSNPPYVLEADKLLMNDNVLKYEPSTALFVPNEDPILFYKAIVKYALTNLKKRGCLYFEIHESYAKQVENCLNDNGFESVTIKEDMQGKPRMIYGRLA